MWLVVCYSGGFDTLHHRLLFFLKNIEKIRLFNIKTIYKKRIYRVNNMEFIQLFNNVIYFQNSEINFIIDKYNNPWFYAKNVLLALDYKDPKSAIKEIIKKENKEHIVNIYPSYKQTFGTSMQPKTVFINEFGLYDLMLKSKLPKAEKFRELITQEILPNIRKQGYYELNDKEKEKMKKINKKLRKKVRIMENKLYITSYNMKKNKYPPKKLVYMIRPQNVDKKIIKVGKTDDFKMRMNVINNSLPDDAEVLYYIETEYVDDLEDKIKKIMKKRGYSYRGKKEYFKVGVAIAKIIYDVCFVNVLKKYDVVDEFINDPELKKINDVVNYIDSDKKLKRLVKMYDLNNHINDEIEQSGLKELEKIYLDTSDDNILFDIDDDKYNDFNEEQQGGYIQYTNDDIFIDYSDSYALQYDDIYPIEKTILSNLFFNGDSIMDESYEEKINELYDLMLHKYKYVKYYVKYTNLYRNISNSS